MSVDTRAALSAAVVLPRTLIPVRATVFLPLLGFGMLLPILPRIAADSGPAGVIQDGYGFGPPVA